ncbi:DJ-1/PfpI family protein [Salipaludibacillus agaradhaerens]|uniref:DJ-1/PfpI family protein n=1 Tax=Salipaludibacillus agaradhaerens TaxID=76935 RepID=A0A9Q4B5R0_SALAG|nr:DJ-1/PfpI family protein [Salipaludibacillus agaradhaerens]MCR6098834.1 DJ-1/PfpI family protein [Salipaludibacillus agaradhaerens]MCR6115841.1 DJ-1/PfpI family protein [Salipaludibacillus agaradhaerens]
MSKKALLIIPPDKFNEDELFKPKEALEKAGIEVTIASTKTGEVIGDFEGKANSEKVFSNTPATDFDVISVIGGSGTIDHLWDNDELSTYLKKAHNDKILVTGICAGSVSVVKAGLLKDREATCYPVDVQKNQLKENNVKYVEKHVIAHSDVITGDGPDGAEEFGKALVDAIN